jgi:hypothetical protein
MFFSPRMTDGLHSNRWGAGGDASVAELEPAGTRDPKWLIDRANKFLDAGAYVGNPSFTGALLAIDVGLDDYDRE